MEKLKPMYTKYSKRRQKSTFIVSRTDGNAV